MDKEIIESLKKRANVVLIRHGTKVTSGVDTGRKAIVVGVKRKVPLAVLTRADTIPKKIKGQLTDVREVGEIKALQVVDPDRLAKHRPAPGGVSIGHPQISAGTLGGWVKKNGEYYALSNNHVFAACNKAQTGDRIPQPGVYDGGVPGRDDLVELSEYMRLLFKSPTVYTIIVMCPNGGEVWEQGSFQKVSWQTNLIDASVRVEISFDNGGYWYTLIPSTPAGQGEVEYKVDIPTTYKALIKVICVEKPEVLDISDSCFSITSPPQPPPSDCKFSRIAGSMWNRTAAFFGRKTRAMMVVPIETRELAPAPTGILEPTGEFNQMDAAIAKVLNPSDVLDEILGLPNATHEFEDPEVGWAIDGSGRTTAVTVATITDIDAWVGVDYGDGEHGEFDGQVIAEGPHCARPGDSGSLRFHNGKRVCLLFAGAPDMLVANWYSKVRDAFGFD